MTLFQIASAAVDSPRIHGITSDSIWFQMTDLLKSVISHPLTTTLIGVAGTLLGVWLTKKFQEKHAERQRERDRVQKEQQQIAAKRQDVLAENTEEGRYLNWIINSHKFLPLGGMPRGEEVEDPELEQIYVSLKFDPQMQKQEDIEIDRMHHCAQKHKKS